MSVFGQGQGLNSIRWRFATAGAVLSALTVTGSQIVLGVRVAGEPRAWAVALGAAVLVGAAFLWMASRLTALVEALRRSTETIAAGDLDAPVDVDCACEIGGLAHSFRKMRSRLNANVLRINTLAHTDLITGLPNRSVIDRLLGYALAPERRGSFHAASMLDPPGDRRGKMRARPSPGRGARARLPP